MAVTETTVAGTTGTTGLVLYAMALSERGFGVAHLPERHCSVQRWTRCNRPLLHMQQILDSTVPEICTRCAATCGMDDSLAYLRGFADASVHAIVTEGFDGSGLLERDDDGEDQDRAQIDGFARALRPGGHVFCRRPNDGVGWSHVRFEMAGFECRGSIVRVGSRPARKPRKTDDLVRTAEFFDLYRRNFVGTVAQCLRVHQTGGLRRVSAERPFCDVIRSDDREDFLAQLRRAALPLGVGVVVDPFRLRCWRGVAGEETAR